MGLLIAFVAGAACAAALIYFFSRGRGDAGTALLAQLRTEVNKFEASQRELNSSLSGQLQTMGASQATLLQRTGQLSEALRRPGVRGRWGESTLKNVVELAGLVDHVDFDTQLHIRGDDGAARPDLVVRLPGGGCVAVDSKVPLDAYLDAVEIDDAEAQEPHLRRHVEAMRAKVRELSAKAYWQRFQRSPEMVVMFVACEPALAVAAERDPELLADAARNHVILASPATMLALLQVVALGWREAALSENAERIRELGAQLVQRLDIVVDHLSAEGKALQNAVEAHNNAVGSVETRLLVTARKMTDLGLTGRLDTPPGVATAVRLPTSHAVEIAAELPGGGGNGHGVDSPAEE